MDFTQIKSFRDHNVLDMVLDTDTYNEVDDQFAIGYMLQHAEKLHVRALYAAPFVNGTLSNSPAEGMQKSFEEIKKLLRLTGREDIPVYRGSQQWLSDEHTPVSSDAAKHLAALAEEYSPERPLFVVAIGAITNVASALLLKPHIAKNIVVVWLGGTAYHVGSTYEFNMIQDIAAARSVFALAENIVQLPCEGVVSEFVTTIHELDYWLKGKNALCDYLCGIVKEHAVQDTAWSRVIWDVTAIAWLLNGENKLLDDCTLPMQTPNYNGGYDLVSEKRVCYVKKVHRDALYTDLFKKLQRY